MPPNAESSGESTEVTKMVETKVPMEMVQLLVEQGMTEVPQKWVQPESVRLQPTVKLQVPSIDLSTLEGDDKGEVKAAIAKAFEEWGFLQVGCLCDDPFNDLIPTRNFLLLSEF